jgi:hypothetical protein
MTSALWQKSGRRNRLPHLHRRLLIIVVAQAVSLASSGDLHARLCVE